MRAAGCKISSWTSVEWMTVDPARRMTLPSSLPASLSDIANNLGQSPPRNGGHDEYQNAGPEPPIWSDLNSQLGHAHFTRETRAFGTCRRSV
jgi:hypothetical protein